MTAQNAGVVPTYNDQFEQLQALFCVYKGLRTGLEDIRNYKLLENRYNWITSDIRLLIIPSF
jgi:hypothetical protein